MNDASFLVLFLAPVKEYLADDKVSEILINGPDHIYIERGGTLQETPAKFASEAQLKAAAVNIAKSVERQLDEMHPDLDARLPDGSRVHATIPPISRSGTIISIRKFKNKKEVMPYARKLFNTLNEAYAPLYGFSKLTPEQIDYYINMYIPMLRYDLVTIVTRDEDDEVVAFGISLPSLSKAMQKAKGHLFPFGWIHLLKALKSKPKVVDLYLMGVLPEYQSKGVNALLFNDLIPIYNKLGVEYAESNPELETNNAVQAQWDYFKREHHKTRRAFIKKIG